MSADAALAERPLAIGDRFQLTAEAVPQIRRRGTTAGRIVADYGDEWKVIYDGSSAKGARKIHKAYTTRETDQ